MAQSNLNRFTLFKRTPISKAFCILCGLSTLWDFYLRPPNEAIRDATLLYCSGGGGGLLNWRRVYVSGRLGEVLRMKIGFKDWRDMFFGLYLFRSVQDVERQLGGKKFGSWCFMVVCFSSAMMMGLEMTYPSLCIRPGPFHLLGALTAAFCAYVPVLPMSSTLAPDSFKFLLTNKTATYLIAAHLATKGGWSSVLPSFAGVLSACICATKLFKDFLLPDIICKFLGAIHPLLKSREEHIDDAHNRILDTQVQVASEDEQHRQSGRVLEALLPPLSQEIPRSERGRMFGDSDGTAMTGPNQRQRTVPGGSDSVPEEAIASLVSMGFTRDESLRALKETRNNVEAAANRLLG